ncbi:MAG TPA: hypothetical protein VLV55_06525 [Rhizomicrobium sp.]|nr:hypothetical protein [Rhizomicrobium sp.]
MGVHLKTLARVLCVAVTAAALSACFDLTQKLSIDRGGSGHYEMAITADGLLGEALKDKKDSAIDLKNNKVRTHLAEHDGKVTQFATMDFKSLSDLKLSDESLSLSNHGAGWFGLGPSHLTFTRTFLVDRARKQNAPSRSNNDDDRFGTELAQTMFGDHTYLFSVSVPGSVDRANAIRVGRTTIAPQIKPSGLSTTVTWRMPLYTMIQAKMLRFEVDFSAYGWFPDAQSLPE